MPVRKPRHQPIRTKGSHPDRLRIGGWLSGRGTYLWFGTPDIGGTKGSFLGYLAGQRLYRIAKAIVRQFEEGQ